MEPKPKEQAKGAQQPEEPTPKGEITELSQAMSLVKSFMKTTPEQSE